MWLAQMTSLNLFNVVEKLSYRFFLRQQVAFGLG